MLVKAQLQEKKRRKILRWKRLLITITVIFSLGIGIILLLSTGHIIDNNLSYIIQAGLTVGGVAIGIIALIVALPIPPTPIEQAIPVPLPKNSQEKDEGYVPFNEVLKRELRKRKWKEKDLAKRIGVSAQDIYKWEKGELEPTSDAYYERLCELFEMTPEEMGLTRDETMGGILRSAFMVDIDRFEDEHD